MAPWAGSAAVTLINADMPPGGLYRQTKATTMTDNNNVGVLWQTGDLWIDLRPMIYCARQVVTENGTTHLLDLDAHTVVRVPQPHGNRLEGDRSVLRIWSVPVATPCGLVLQLDPRRRRYTTGVLLVFNGLQPDWPDLTTPVPPDPFARPTYPDHPPNKCGAIYCRQR